jgi:hypothetical protein
MGIPTDLVVRLRDYGNARTFVETGTYYGEATFWAANEFDVVITIERSEVLFESLLDTSVLCAYPNVFPVLGDSSECLSYVVSGLH